MWTHELPPGSRLRQAREKYFRALTPGTIREMRDTLTARGSLGGQEMIRDLLRKTLEDYEHWRKHQPLTIQEKINGST